MTRREALRWMGNGFGMVGLANVCRFDSQGPLAPKAPHFPPRAKRVIFLFLNGGMSQVDTFDPKPMLDQARRPADARAEDRDRPRFGQSDALAVQVSEIRAERARGQRDLSRKWASGSTTFAWSGPRTRTTAITAFSADDELRAQAAGPAVDGLVDHLRTGHGEPESAWFHGALSRASRCLGAAAVGFGVSARHVSGHIHSERRDGSGQSWCRTSAIRT